MVVKDRRKNQRLNTTLDGSFTIANSGDEGVLFLSNLGKEGFRATLNRKVEPGQQLECEMRFSQSIMPFFITGKVVWVQENSQDQMPGFDVGVSLEQIDTLERQRILDFAFADSSNNASIENFSPIEIQP